MPVMVRVLEKSTVSDRVKKVLKTTAQELSEKFNTKFEIENVWYNESPEWCNAEFTDGNMIYQMEYEKGIIKIERIG